MEHFSCQLLILHIFPGAIVFRVILDGMVSGTASRFTPSAVSDGGRFGSSLATGDYDGNGEVDLAVGAPTAAPSGAVYVYMNLGSTLPLSPA